jgi:hypothetical protein
VPSVTDDLREISGAGMVEATRDALTVAVPYPVSGAVDVLFDGRRVWSIATELMGEGPTVLPWPDALVPYLHGQAEVVVRKAETGDVVARGAVRLGNSELPIAVVDADGSPLVVNKWGRLSRSLEGQDALLEQLLTDADSVFELLHELGLPAYLVGGSLLGAMRSGDFLAHDDDIDIAYLSPHSSPADLSLESYRIQRHLEAAGHVVVRHSSAHLQVVFYSSPGRAHHYVDIFTAFYKDGWYCQPFALRGRLGIGEVVPTSTVTLRGHVFPAPAVPGSWLQLAYGRWETPDPSFRFRTPEATTRRFHAWFGQYHAQREYWTGWVGFRAGHSGTASAEADEFAAMVSEPGLIVELGAGTGTDARYLAEQGHEVWAVDYALQYGRPPFEHRRGLEYRMVNLAELRDALSLAAEATESRRPVWIYARDIGGMVREARGNMLRALAAMPGFRAGMVTFDTDESPLLVNDDPTTWHLPVELFEEECRKVGLRASVLREFDRPTPAGVRRHAVLRVEPGR